jgi:hypothetical protein
MIWASDTATLDYFGMAVGVGRHAVVAGAPGDDTMAGEDAGSAYFYRIDCPLDCYADFDGSEELDLFDFLAFVNAFNAGEESKADCDQNQSLDLFDFLCFVNAFNEGC